MFSKKMEELSALNNLLKRVLEVRKRENPMYDI